MFKRHTPEGRMTNRWWAGLAFAATLIASTNVFAQGAVTLWQYNLGAITTPNSGDSVPAQADSSGNLNVNCVVGCGSGSGSTNSNINKINGVAALAGAGATGTGSLRTTTAQDATTVAGSAPGTAGTPSVNVISVQGVANGTAMPISVTATFNGFDSGPIQVVSPTLNAGSYSAGMSLGGLFSVPIGRINGGSGGLSLIGYKSTAGSVGQVVFRIWQKNPASTTCTDHTAFVSNATDDVQLLVAPFAQTPAAAAVTTGDTATYASIQPGRLSWVNSDTSPSKNLYVCVITVATDTVDESNTVAVRLSGDLN